MHRESYSYATLLGPMDPTIGLLLIIIELCFTTHSILFIRLLPSSSAPRNKSQHVVAEQNKTPLKRLCGSRNLPSFHTTFPAEFCSAQLFPLERSSRSSRGTPSKGDYWFARSPARLYCGLRYVGWYRATSLVVSRFCTIYIDYSFFAGLPIKNETIIPGVLSCVNL